MPTVALCGLGAMGKGMAARLADFLASGKVPGFSGPLLVYNRTAAVAQQFATETAGVQAMGSVAELASAHVVVSMLANDAATEAVCRAWLAALSARGGGGQQQPVFVNAATILPATVKKLEAEAQQAGALLLNCPVFGRPDAAAAGSLIAVPAGAAAARQAVAPLLPAYAGRGVWDLGDDPAASAALKLVGNFWIVSQIEVAAQCLALAGKSGIDSGAVVRMLETFLGSPIPLGYAQRMAAGDYSSETGFAVDLALKDVGHMRALAADTACPLPLADLAFGHLLQAKASHGGQLDWGAIHLAVRQSAGLPPNTQDSGQ